MMSSELSKDLKDPGKNLNLSFNNIKYTAGLIRSPKESAAFQMRDPVPVPPDSASRDRRIEEQVLAPTPSSSYILASDQSLYSTTVNVWRSGLNTENASVQHSRAPLVQRSTLATTSNLDPTGMWYIMAMILPLFSVNNCMQWRCTPSDVIDAAEIFLGQVVRFCGQTRAQLQRLAEDQLTRDLFATLMDIVLVVYAIGFLILSLYQASVFG